MMIAYTVYFSISSVMHRVFDSSYSGVFPCFAREKLEREAMLDAAFFFRGMQLGAAGRPPRPRTSCSDDELQWPSGGRIYLRGKQC